MSLIRFHQAQAEPVNGYATALAEIRRGRKTSHWIWYIFPQLAGLGHSPMATRFAIRDLDEASNYLRDPLLRARYEEIARAVHTQLGHGLALEELMDSQIYALKFVSSITLFRQAVEHLAEAHPTSDSIVQLCDSILAQCAAQGYQPCAKTAAALSSQI